MAVTINRVRRAVSRLSVYGWGTIVLAAALAGVVWFTARQGLWPLAILAVVAAELVGRRGRSQSVAAARKQLLAAVPAIMMGASTALMIATLPRGRSQIVVGILYGVWRVWSSRVAAETRAGLFNLMLLQVAIFEAIFLMAAIWRIPDALTLVVLWAAAYVSVYTGLVRRGERAAGVMAATWALVVTEIAWVCLTWLVSYVIGGGYLIVPQPTLILSALAYCFGSIYASQRQGMLSRARLTEYLLIGLIVIAVVVIGTPWRGSL